MYAHTIAMYTNINATLFTMGRACKLPNWLIKALKMVPCAQSRIPVGHEKNKAQTDAIHMNTENIRLGTSSH